MTKLSLQFGLIVLVTGILINDRGLAQTVKPSNPQASAQVQAVETAISQIRMELESIDESLRRADAEYKAKQAQYEERVA